jgi:LPXTG-site transpeptidase (sortase) family protein
VKLELFGPFSRRADVDCRHRRLWSGRITVRGASEARSPGVKLTRAGFYAYRVRLAGGRWSPAGYTECAFASDTVLAAPSIVAGRGEAYAATPADSTSSLGPTRVRIPSLGIDAPVKPAAIDVRHGVLAIPLGIGLAGWWQDGSLPGGTAGAILVAGHVDSAKAGAGAFFKLGGARVGARVRLATAGGRAFAYRVVSVRSYPKSALPTTIYSRQGPSRLVLVTCGGPFDEATGHYRDNVVVTAVPEPRR